MACHAVCWLPTSDSITRWLAAVPWPCWAAANHCGVASLWVDSPSRCTYAHVPQMTAADALGRQAGTPKPLVLELQWAVHCTACPCCQDHTMCWLRAAATQLHMLLCPWQLSHAVMMSCKAPASQHPGRSTMLPHEALPFSLLPLWSHQSFLALMPYRMYSSGAGRTLIYPANTTEQWIPRCPYA